MDINEILLENLKTGFIEESHYSEGNNQPVLLYNDKQEGKKVLTSIINELEDCDEFWFSVAFITTGGVATLINTLIDLEKRNVRGKILASQYLNFTQPYALKQIRQFKNIELRISTFGDFHSKGYLFRKKNIYKFVIGSSNLTNSALCTNKEWNLQVSATNESKLSSQVLKEFKKEFDLGCLVTDDFLLEYEKVWKAKVEFENQVKGLSTVSKEVCPNLMQKEALDNIDQIRKEGKTKALLISATGTGKTYLSAFDVKRFKPKRFLFIVHRRTIAEKALETFKSLIDEDVSMAFYSSLNKNMNADYIFSTIQTFSREKHLHQFNPNHFDYIVIDETHRASADSYKKIMNYFSPKFLLGMTATPERTDGENVFELFDYNVAYKIRLHRALEEKMITPFHYYGVSDIVVNDQAVNEKSDFNLLVLDKRVDHIIESIKRYGCDNGNIRGVVFCPSNEVASQLSSSFNQHGYNTVALSGVSSEEDRKKSIDLLESECKEEQLDYIFTRDIFNEGIDIPKVNQVIMLRPTTSAIVFIQQLGRGLRKTSNKEYLTVIDFIGNYDNNYLIPVALFGDTTYNKDKLRRLISNGSSLIQGESTVNFDKISKEKIFESINSSNMQLKKDLDKSYQLLKFELGRIPMMVDFLTYGSRDPYQYVDYAKSYFNYISKVDNNNLPSLSFKECKLLELFAKEINNAKRVEEALILKELINHRFVKVKTFKETIKTIYGYEISDQTIDSCIFNLNFEFTREKKDRKEKSPRDIYNLNIIKQNKGKLFLESEFEDLLKNRVFKKFLVDNITASIQVYDKRFKPNRYILGFNLYQKYTRKDVFRILNCLKNPIAQNVGGYKITDDKKSCPIFVNYKKDESISDFTKYEDEFIDPSTFQWMSKNKRYLKSPDVMAIRNYKDGLRLPLFIKKSNDEGLEFYYMGDITPIEDSFMESTIVGDKGKEVSVVKVTFTMNHPVEDSIYKYITK